MDTAHSHPESGHRVSLIGMLQKQMRDCFTFQHVAASRVAIRGNLLEPPVCREHL